MAEDVATKTVILEVERLVVHMSPAFGKAVSLPHREDWVSTADPYTGAQVRFVNGKGLVSAQQLAGLNEHYPEQVLALGETELVRVEVVVPKDLNYAEVAPAAVRSINDVPFPLPPKEKPKPKVVKRAVKKVSK